MKSRIVGFLGTLTVIGCHNEPLASPSAGGISLALSVAHTQFQRGQRDTIAITLTNATDTSVTLNFSTGCQVLPYIANGRGDIVLPSGGDYVCTAAFSKLQLAPGEQHTQALVWSGSTQFVTELPLLPLPPGIYSVFAVMSAQELRLATRPVSVELR